MPEQDVTHFQNTPGKLHFSEKLRTLVFTQNMGTPTEETWVCSKDPLTIFFEYNQSMKAFSPLQRHLISHLLRDTGKVIDATIVTGTGESSFWLTSCIISIDSQTWNII